MRRASLFGWPAAAAGLVLLLLLMPGRDSALLPKPAHTITRDGAIAQASAIARKFGVDLKGWRFYVEADVPRSSASVAARYPGTPILRAFPPHEIDVIAGSPDGSLWVRIEFHEGGDPTRWSWRRGAHGGDIHPQNMDPAAVLALFAGSHAAEFQLEENGKDKERDEANQKKTWRWTAQQPQGLSAIVEAEWRDGVLKDARLRTDVSSALNREVRPDRIGVDVILEPFGVVFIVVAFIAGGWYGLSRLLKRRDHLRFVWRLIVPYAIIVLLAFRFGHRMDANAFQAWNAGGLPKDAWDIGELLRRCLIVAGSLGGGFVILRGWQIRAWTGTLLAGTRRAFSMPVGREIAAGWLLGPALAAVAYLVAFLWPGSGPVTLNDPAWMFDRRPVLSIAAEFAARHVGLICLLGILAPWILRGGKTLRRMRGGTLVFAAVCLVYGSNAMLQNSQWASALGAVAMAAIVWYAYTQMGLLAALTAFLSADLSRAGVFQGLVSGWTSAITLELWLAWLAVLIGSLWLRRDGAHVDVDELAIEMARRNDPPPTLDLQPERERLQSEFAVAAEVQRGVLPSEYPSIPGYSIAAECRPAREVGGDLYDFLTLPDGRWALCVADVSGKGVPASLYMTLTKGMLTAESAQTRDLVQLAQSLNRILHEAGRRRTFVTLVMAALDPAAHVAEILRAGHSAALLWRAAAGEIRFVQPAGMGLGLASDGIFERSIATESIDLQPGDVLVLYSDGLTEATDPDQDLFGDDRAAETLRRSAALPAEGIVAAFNEDLAKFTRGAEPHDDLTILVLRREPIS